VLLAGRPVNRSLMRLWVCPDLGPHGSSFGGGAGGSQTWSPLLRMPAGSHSCGGSTTKLQFLSSMLEWAACAGTTVYARRPHVGCFGRIGWGCPRDSESDRAEISATGAAFRGPVSVLC
jgi:hypothetical protein